MERLLACAPHGSFAHASQADAGPLEETESLKTKTLAGHTPTSEAGDKGAMPPVLMPGTRLGPYLILDLFGEGGMGKVYRGLDTRLGRTVAIKISAGQCNQRFEQEVRAIAALNHPHICTLYDVGPGYMVTELVEGETLCDWLKRSPSVDRIMEIARQILEALHAAHRGGIVHHDLKPQNIMVRFDGYVKLLDFGLAQQMPDETPAGPGKIFGTVAYMSPEQIQGQPADQRSDLFSFGIILYEMLTGRHPWPRTTPVEMRLAILRDDAPPMINLAEPFAAGLTSIVRKLLCKCPADRYPFAGKVLEELAGRAVCQECYAVGGASPKPSISIGVLPLVFLRGVRSPEASPQKNAHRPEKRRKRQNTDPCPKKNEAKRRGKVGGAFAG